VSERVMYANGMISGWPAAAVLPLLIRQRA
jgi:hypothetical protein